MIFPEKACTFILESLSGHIWTLKYAISSWFAESLGKPKLQVCNFGRFTFGITIVDIFL